MNEQTLKKIYVLGTCAMIATPAVVSANIVADLLVTVLNVLDLVVIIIMALALIFFLWGVAKFILNAGDEAERSKGKQIMLWGIIALFVMVSVWGIVSFISDQFELGDDRDIHLPTTPR